jgi:hypothetical protein
MRPRFAGLDTAPVALSLNQSMCEHLVIFGVFKPTISTTHPTLLEFTK